MYKDKTFRFKSLPLQLKTHHSIYFMFTVIGIMFVGIGLGYLMHHRPMPHIGRAITVLIWLLLFLLGLEVGHNEQIILSLPTLGVEACIIAMACVTGSCIAAWGLWKYTGRKKEGNT